MSQLREQPVCHSTYNLCGCVQLPPLLALPLVSGFWLPWLRVGQTTGEDAGRAEVAEWEKGTGSWAGSHGSCGSCGLWSGTFAGSVSLSGAGVGLSSGLSLKMAGNGGSADRGAGTARTQTTGALSAGGLSRGAVWSLWPRKPSCLLWDSG